MVTIGLARTELPVIRLESSDEIDPALICKTHRRRRNFISGVKLNCAPGLETGQRGSQLAAKKIQASEAKRGSTLRPGEVPSWPGFLRRPALRNRSTRFSLD